MGERASTMEVVSSDNPLDWGRELARSPRPLMALAQRQLFSFHSYSQPESWIRGILIGFESPVISQALRVCCTGR